MPGVTVLSPPALGGFASSPYSSQSSPSRSLPHSVPIHSTSQIPISPLGLEMQNGNGSPPSHRESIAEIKEAAKEQARKVRGASAVALLKLARSQISLAQAREGEDDLKGALSAFTIGVSLAHMVMESPDFKKGALGREFIEFQQVRLSHPFLCLLCSHHAA